MSTTTKSGVTQPAVIGGLVMGVLSALPLVSAGNLCCCLWVVGGGVVAAYVMQQNQSRPMTAGDGALVGLLAGIIGACVYLVLSIPIALVMAPFQRQIMERIAESDNMPPAFRDYVNSMAGPTVQLIFGFLFMLVAGAVFSTLGGVLGSAIFAKKVPPPPPDGTIDVPSPGL